MQTSRVTLFFVLILLFGLSVQTVSAGGVTADPMKFDRHSWGLRKLIVPLENVMDDTARIEIVLDMRYVDNYMSGLESITVDTSLSLPPKHKETVDVIFELPGSFGRMNTKVTVRYHYDNQPADAPPYDSLMQNFSNAFPARGDAEEFEAVKQSLCPAAAQLEHSRLNFDLPRLTLYLFSRGDTTAHISRLFAITPEDVQTQVERLRGWGLFPFTGADSLAPAVVAISEKEGYAIRGELKTLGDEFAAWYDDEAKPALDAIAADEGIDPEFIPMHELRMAMLYQLMMEPYAEADKQYNLPTFENPKQDKDLFDFPRAIIQGGDFFMPRVMLAAFSDDSMLALSTFRARPTQPFDKLVLVELNRDAEDVFKLKSQNVAMVPVEWVQKVMKKARDKGVVAGFHDRFAAAVDRIAAKLPTFRAYQQPYLADYVCRVVLGGYFQNVIDARKAAFTAIRY